ncbi:hypothetical protein XF30_30330 [Bradyrhizobium sp. SUTN9-2]|nr:hypothetical protein XF30_30330 [Bradyrhizobium sp. SUTN9-2]
MNFINLISQIVLALLVQPVGEERQCVRSWPAVVVLKGSTCFGDRSGRKRGVTLGLAFKNSQPSGGIPLHGDNVLAPHGHLAMIFPTQAIDADSERSELSDIQSG